MPENMARTRLFGQLRRIAAGVLAERRAGLGGTQGPRPHLTRRQLTLGAAQLVAAGALAACGSDDDDDGGGGIAGSGNAGGQGGDGGSGPELVRVAVVGGGIAGLHCAYRLQQAGVDVTLFEASSRFGGRMFSARDDDYDGQVFELGGELIDSNHSTLRALAEELGITLDDRFDDSIQPDVWFVNGAEVPEETVVEQFKAVAPAMADAVTAADDEEDDTAFNELDQTPLGDWLEQHVPSADFPELNAILTAAYRGEFGLETDQQSALNLLYLIGSDEPDPFRIFGESDERYHAREGSDAFPNRLAEKVSALRMSAKLTQLSGDDEHGFTLKIADVQEGTEHEEQFDRVVLAIPFSVLRLVTLEVPLSDLKRQIIDELGYGTNAKVIGQFDARVWREEHGKSGSVTSDLPLQQTWDSSIGQPGERGILTNFLGGQAGVDVGEGEAEDYYTGLLSDLDQIFPGTAEAYRAGSARRMHWPSYEHTLGSYTCYKPGQWSFWGSEGLREGNVHFCGEHTSVDFQGWMEGGAETGARVASEILKDLGIALPDALAGLIETKAAQPPRALPRARARLMARARSRPSRPARPRARP
jgi:monoamine oxidase